MTNGQFLEWIKVIIIGYSVAYRLKVAYFTRISALKYQRKEHLADDISS